MIIKGNTVGTPMPRTNYEQTDPTKADYLRGKEVLDQKIEAARKAGVDAASNAQTAADNAQTAADNAQTAAGNAQTAAENAEKNAKEYADGLTGEKAITRAKLADDALYSPVLNLSTAENTLSADMLGKTVMCRITGEDFSLTIPKEVHDTLPVGFEFALVYWNAATSVKIYLTGGVSACMANEGAIENATLALPGRYSMVALKKCTSQSWLVTGDVEVV